MVGKMQEMLPLLWMYTKGRVKREVFLCNSVLKFGFWILIMEFGDYMSRLLRSEEINKKNLV